MDKHIADDIDWKDTPNDSNYIASTDSLLDSNGASIPGLSYELSVRRGRFEDDCRFTFTVFKIKGRRQRAYQICVYPPEFRSHREGPGKWWNRAEQFSPPVNLTCRDHEKWFREFLRRAKITFGGKYLPPTSARLI